MGSPLRVLHVVVNMNRGGAETLIMNLYRNIDREKVQFDFLTCKPGVFDMEIKKMGGRIYRIPYITDVGHFQYVKGLDEFFLEHQEYDIVHSHLDKMSGFVLRAAKKAGVPVRIAHSHNTRSEGNIVTRTYKWFSGKLIESNSTLRLACSNLAAKWLFEKKATIIKNGIESERFEFSIDKRNKIRNELNLDESTMVLGHVGRFAKQKNHSFLINVFANYLKVNPNSTLILVGDGPLRKDIENKVHRLNLKNNVKFLGIRNDIDNLLQAMDVFIFPSLHEGLPVSLIEAQGSGLTCLISEGVSTEVDLGMELVNFLPLTSTKAWVDQLKSVSKNTRLDVRKQLLEQGYDISSTAKKIQSIYLNQTG
ncbi:glycosyltransferase family 1 protein [Robertmurraya sp. P23]|uniref:glycosyltransferase family 1 protein n=1 Tax=Robertmurraya sp. P23 TaxID=3436931 RepID=UPI003D9565D2